VELVVERAAALDVGKDEVVACIRVPDAAGGGRGRGRRRQEVRTYPTFTSSLEALADWLQAEGVTQVVMAATGQYWKPVVRHEALSDRAEVQDLRHLAVAAAG
jgi:transposase